VDLLFCFSYFYSFSRRGSFFSLFCVSPSKKGRREEEEEEEEKRNNHLLFSLIFSGLLYTARIHHVFLCFLITNLIKQKIFPRAVQQRRRRRRAAAAAAQRRQGVER
jgi:hypothetical protein